MRGLRGEIFLFVVTLIICICVVRALGEDPKLKPGDEVKVTELEAAKLGKLKAQVEHVEAQKVILQQQFLQLQAERSQIQSKLDELVKTIQARVKAESAVDVLYDQAAGEDGTFRVTAPAPKPAEPKK